MARVLKIFMRGKSVRMLQEFLRSMGYKVNDRDSMFGASTRDAVKSFQRQRGLKVTGQVDNELLQLMQQAKAGSSVCGKEAEEKSSVAMVSQKKFNALVRLMVRKGLFDEQELYDEMERVIPVSITQPPLV